MRKIGTSAYGVRMPFIKGGEDLVSILIDEVIKCSDTDNFVIKDRDIIGVTESLLARSQNNFVKFDDLIIEFKNKFKDVKEIGVVFPILSRNRVSLLIKALSIAFDKVYLQLDFPNDEVGNPIVSREDYLNYEGNVMTDVMSETDYREMFGYITTINPFTGVDMVKYYKELNDNIEIIISSKKDAILDYTHDILVADVHSRHETYKILSSASKGTVLKLDDIMNESINGSGYNKKFGMLGWNVASENVIKLFPRDGDAFVNKIKDRLFELTGKNVEVLIYGDGAFKDPVLGIWELYDPEVSPYYTDGLKGTPTESKLKYLIDSNKSNSEIEAEIKLSSISNSIGTTPRNITDLIGSLCDLISGSGDKGTPVVYISGYFDKYTDN